MPSSPSYIISDDICYMALCEPSYPPTLAFSYLENVNTEFIGQYSQEIHKAHRPYYFIEFGELLWWLAYLLGQDNVLWLNNN